MTLLFSPELIELTIDEVDEGNSINTELASLNLFFPPVITVKLLLKQSVSYKAV